MRLGKALAVGVVEETSQQTTRRPVEETTPRVAESVADVHAERDSEAERSKAPETAEPVATPPSR